MSHICRSVSETFLTNVNVVLLAVVVLLDILLLLSVSFHGE